MMDYLSIIEKGNDSKIARVFNKEANKVLLEVEYNLIYKGIGDKKAQNMYGIYKHNETELFNEAKLLKSETFEVEIKNISEIVKLLLDNKEVEEEYMSDLEGLIHTHDNEGYRVMCNTSFLENKEVAINTFKMWLLLTTGLIYLNNFSEANTFIDKNENWYNDLSEKYVVRI